MLRDLYNLIILVHEPIVEYKEPYFMLPTAIIDQIVQAISKAVWERPELARLREPIEATLKAGSFKALTVQALQDLESRTVGDLPEFFDEGYLAMPLVKEALAAYLVKGDDADITRLTELYSKRFPRPTDAPAIEPLIRSYLTQARETFAADPVYCPLLLARALHALVAAGHTGMESGIRLLFGRTTTKEHVDAFIAALNDIQKHMIVTIV